MKREQKGKEDYLTEKGMCQRLADRKPSREYKDRIFRMIFKEKKEFLELYNAMNETHYTNEEDLTVTTLENAILQWERRDGRTGRAKTVKCISDTQWFA